MDGIFTDLQGTIFQLFDLVVCQGANKYVLAHCRLAPRNQISQAGGFLVKMDLMPRADFVYLFSFGLHSDIQHFFLSECSLLRIFTAEEDLSSISEWAHQAVDSRCGYTIETIRFFGARVHDSCFRTILAPSSQWLFIFTSNHIG